MEFLTSIGNWFCGHGAGYGSMTGFGHGSSSWMPFHFGGFGGIFNLLILGMLAFLIIRAVRRPQPAHESIALDVIKRRYAEGEIDHETYMKLRNELRR